MTIHRYSWNNSGLIDIVGLAGTFERWLHRSTTIMIYLRRRRLSRSDSQISRKLRSPFCASYARVTPESSFSSSLCQTCSSRFDSALVCCRQLTSASLLTDDHPPKMTGLTRLKEAIERHRENKDINIKYKTPLTSKFTCQSLA